MKRITPALFLLLLAGGASADMPFDSGPYSYDAAGNITTIGDDSYVYDRFGRLRNATAKTPLYPTNAQQFDYDRYGNMTAMTTSGGISDHVDFAVVPESNRVAAQCMTAACVRAEYDGAGNEVGRYQWDAAGMMTEATLTGRHEQYVYDANDERIATVSLSEQTTLYTLRGAGHEVDREFVHDDKLSGTWKWSKDYVYRGGKLFAAWVAGETQMEPTRHYHVDHLGTARLITDGQGYKLSKHTYFPFGVEAPGSDPAPSERLRFTGHERDSDYKNLDEDLDYMHARSYRPGWGRFLSVDPALDLKSAVGAPQFWNRYAYVGDHPLNAIDPAGRREALVYGQLLNVEPGDVIVLVDPKTRKVKHVVIVGGFKEGKKGQTPSALIYENIPRPGPNGKNAFEKPRLTDSNDPHAGGGIWNADRTDIGGVVENNRRIRLDHSTIFQDFTREQVAAAVDAVGRVQYDKWSIGTMGPQCDCAGFVNQVLRELGGTADFAWHGIEFEPSGFRFETYGFEPKDWLASSQ